VISRYLASALSGNQQSEWSNPERAPGNDVVRIKRLKITSIDENTSLTMQAPLCIETIYWVLKDGVTTHITYHLINELGVIVLTTGIPNVIRESGIYRSVCLIPANLLNSGGYFLKFLVVQDENRVTYVNENVASFIVHDTAERDSAWMGREPGAVQPILTWQTEKI
jgi:lipopolysaccharide transport system ATP-binding protein